MREPAFAKLRRKIADKIVGRQTVLFTSAENIERIQTGRYTDLPDHVLGAVTRRWFNAIEQAHTATAREKRKPVSVMTGQHAVLALAAYAKEANAETVDIHVRGSVDGGKTDEVFHVTLKRLKDYSFEGPPVETVRDGEDKIVSLTFRFDNPEYDQWKATRDSGSDRNGQDREDGLGARASQNGPQGHRPTPLSSPLIKRD